MFSQRSGLITRLQFGTKEMMPVYENDRHGFGRAVRGASNILRVVSPPPAADSALLDDMRPLAGPRKWRNSPFTPKRWYRAIESRLLSRQYQFNEGMLFSLGSLVSRTSHGEFVPAANKPLLQFLMFSDMTRNDTGGSARVWGLARAFSKSYRVQMVCILRGNRKAGRWFVYPDVEIVCLPLSREMEEEGERRKERFGPASVLMSLSETDVPFPLLDHWLNRVTAGAALLILVGPYAYSRVARYARQVPIVYDSHEVNLHYIERMAGSVKSDAVDRMKTIEEQVMKAARLVACVCDQDADEVRRLYPGEFGKIVVAPNGVDVERAGFFAPSESVRLARDFGLDKPVVLFVGSVWHANLSAIAHIRDVLAPALPDMLWVVMGVSGREFLPGAPKRSLPHNLVVMGRVSESEKEAAFALAPLAVAPISVGQGTSLKIPDYLAHGKRLVSTPIGMRGFESFSPFTDTVELQHFAPTISSVWQQIEKKSSWKDEQAVQARDAVRRELDWSVIVAGLKSSLSARKLS